MLAPEDAELAHQEQRLRRLVQATFADLGRLSLKNIDRQVQAYRVDWGQGRQQAAVTAATSHSARAGKLAADRVVMAELPALRLEATSKVGQ